MKNAGIFFTIFTALAIMAGCAGNYELVKTAGSTIRQNVFQEATPAGDAPVSGYADLRIYSSLKTHTAGIYSGKDIHGTTEYKMIVNIDGQAAELFGAPRRENSEARTAQDPEAGDGMRYRFSKNIRIKAGPHKVIIAIPSDGLAIEREITLTDGSSNSLVVEPTYGVTSSKQRPGSFGVTSFTEGIRGIRLTLNGSHEGMKP